MNTTQSNPHEGTTEHLAAVQAAADEASHINGHTFGPLETYECPSDRLHQRLSQASAMLTMILGEGHKVFANTNETIQDWYLMAIRSLVDAARVDAELVSKEARP